MAAESSPSLNVADLDDVTVACQPALELLATLEPWIQQQQLAVTAVAAPTGFEGLRAEWVMRQWQALGLEPQLDAAGNVVAERAGTGADNGLVMVSAHLDTAFAPGTAVRPERRDGRLWAPGIGDNSAGLAALLALARVLHQARLRTPLSILFVANVGEEGEGDLKGMRHLFSSASPYAGRIRHSIVVDGPGAEQITCQALPSRRLKLIFEAPGGHSWSNLGGASAIHAAVRTAAALLAQVAPQPGVLGCNIGVVQGGSALNAIAAEAILKLDLRASDAAGLETLSQAVRRAIAAGLEQENAAAITGASRVRVELIGERPAGDLPADSTLLALVRAVDERLGIGSRLERASTDANIPLSQGRSALRLGAGGSGGGAHTLQEWYDPAGRTLALQRLLLILLAACRLP
ncbi:MAG TPA: M20/M25/M40 family metallo-hydrolase [Terriglobales bacterium]|nr:M20/M25/M40 family metallo-hydrolase [Terriglobales bacterium]